MWPRTSSPGGSRPSLSTAARSALSKKWPETWSQFQCHSLGEERVSGGSARRGDGGADVGGDAVDGAQGAEGGEGAIVGAGAAADRVVDLARTVDADGDDELEIRAPRPHQLDRLDDAGGEPAIGREMQDPQ